MATRRATTAVLEEDGKVVMAMAAAVVADDDDAIIVLSIIETTATIAAGAGRMMHDENERDAIFCNFCIIFCLEYYFWKRIDFYGIVEFYKRDS